MKLKNCFCWLSPWNLYKPFHWSSLRNSCDLVLDLDEKQKTNFHETQKTYFADLVHKMQKTYFADLVHEMLKTFFADLVHKIQKTYFADLVHETFCWLSP